jgi:DNA polymerase-3 subunit alpha
MGVHAGGLIIANQPLYDLVPLVKRKDNPQASAWVEGLHGQDLGPVGLVKFDLLVISNLLQIARCCEMVKKRHGLDGICNKPGEPDWTDVPKWRNDKTALDMANIGDLKCIFQFDSEGMRGLVRAGGVDRFEDLVAYTALFRPGPLGMKMQERYVERKRGRETYILHPLVKPILEKTYGVLTYQEQIMRILNVVGEIPLKDCELVRKAISKKKVEGFISLR